MGRHYKIPRISYRSKAVRVREEEEAKRRRTEALPTKERQVCGFLHGFAIDVLQAAGKGYGVDETVYARDLVRMLNDS